MLLLVVAGGLRAIPYFFVRQASVDSALQCSSRVRISPTIAHAWCIRYCYRALHALFSKGNRKCLVEKCCFFDESIFNDY